MKRYILLTFLQCALLSNHACAIDWPMFGNGVKKSASRSGLLAPCALLVHSLYNGARYAKAAIMSEDTAHITQSWIKQGVLVAGAITGLHACCELISALDKRLEAYGAEKSKYTGRAVTNVAVLSGLALAGWAYLTTCGQNEGKV